MSNNQGVLLIIIVALAGAFLAPNWVFSALFLILAVAAPYQLEDEEDEKVNNSGNSL